MKAIEHVPPVKSGPTVYKTSPFSQMRPAVLPSPLSGAQQGGHALNQSEHVYYTCSLCRAGVSADVLLIHISHGCQLCLTIENFELPYIYYSTHRTFTKVLVYVIGLEFYVFQLFLVFIYLCISKSRKGMEKILISVVLVFMRNVKRKTS